MPLKNIPKGERPREKAMQQGIQSLSDAELVALLLRSGIKNCSVLELANQLLIEFKGLTHLFQADLQFLMKIKGINAVKALDIKVCYEIANRLNKRSEVDRKRTILSAKDVYLQYHLFAQQSHQEFFYVIFLNIKLHILQEEKLFVGGFESSNIDLKVIFKKALLCNASKMICFHNHPSGDATPSPEDILLTQQIKKMGEIVHIRLLDHVIIGTNNYYSLIENKQYFVSPDTF